MTDESNCKLIDLVQARPSIYDKTDIYYSNKDHVKSVWNEIANEMQQTVPVCQKRWRYLRDYFVRQLHMTQMDQKRSYWSLYYRMLFLEPFSTTRKVRTDNSAAFTETMSKRKRKRLKKSHNDTPKISNQIFDQNLINTPIVSISSDGNSNDEFNSLDYLNLYQAHFGSADDEALQVKIHQQIKSDQQQKNIDMKQFNSNDNFNVENFEKSFTNLTNFIERPISRSSSVLTSLNEAKNSFDISSLFEDDIQLLPPTTTATENPTTEMGNKFQKKSEVINEILSIMRNESMNEPDEHEHFFKSLLTNVRKIDEDLIVSFRTEILQIVMKYRYMTQQQQQKRQHRQRQHQQQQQQLNIMDLVSSSTNNQSQNNINYNDDSELIIIDTGETDWRNKLKNRF